MARIRGEMVRHESADRASTEEGIALLDLLGLELELWEEQEPPEKRRLLDFLCLNTEFREGKLSVTWKKPYNALAESIESANKKGVAFDESSDAYPEWYPRADLNR